MAPPLTECNGAILRPYQSDLNARIEAAIAAGHRRIIAVLPTGGGKTVCFADIAQRLSDGLKSVLVIAHRREIIKQTSAKLTANGVRHGLILSGVKPRPLERVQVASIQTLWPRAFRSEAMQRPNADWIVVDECHHSLAKTYKKIIEAYPDAIVIGWTATPARGDGRGLGGLFDVLIEGPQVAELIGLGHLVPTVVFAPTRPDLEGVRVQAGDYVEDELAERMDRPKLVGDIVTQYLKHGERRPGVCFATSVAHSRNIYDAFNKAGVRCEHIDGSTPKDERDAILRNLASGAIDVVSNCAVLVEGWDCPDVSCCILARPTRKMSMYRQMIGRVLRPAKGKTDAVILDHSGACYAHGLPEDRVEWTLDPNKRAESPEHQQRQQSRGGGLLECTQCQALRLGGQKCPNCGFLPHKPAKFVATVDADLARFEKGVAKKVEADAAERAKWHGMFTWIAGERGYARGWISHKYREKFGDWPPFGDAKPVVPTPECRSWVKSRMIAYAKGLVEKQERERLVP